MPPHATVAAGCACAVTVPVFVGSPVGAAVAVGVGDEAAEESLWFVISMNPITMAARPITAPTAPEMIRRRRFAASRSALRRAASLAS